MQVLLFADCQFTHSQCERSLLYQGLFMSMVCSSLYTPQLATHAPRRGTTGNCICLVFEQDRRKMESEVNAALEKLGRFSRWQLLIYSLISISLNVSGTWHMLSVVFIGQWNTCLPFIDKTNNKWQKDAFGSDNHL